MKGAFTADQKDRFQVELAKAITEYFKTLPTESVLEPAVVIEYYAHPVHVKAALAADVPINDRATFPSRSMTFVLKGVAYGQVGMVRERLYPPEEF